jgi:glycosyltransferase involved in cell wall biosynthesis
MEAVVEYLSCQLVLLGHSVTVICANDRPYTEVETREGVRVIRLARAGVLFSQPILPTLPFWVWREARASDVLHLHSPNPLAELLCLRWKRKLVVTYHCDVVSQRLLLPVYSFLSGRLLGAARSILVASRRLLETSASLAAFHEKSRVIPFGIRVSPAGAPPLVGAPFALFVGRLVPYKGLPLLLRAMPAVQGRLLVAGEGPERGRLQKEAAELGLEGKVEFLGSVDETRLSALYEACTALVLPSTSRAEAFGMVIIEAMARGKPVVSCRLDTGVTEVNEHEVTGLTVPVADSPALAAALNRLFADPTLTNRLGENGRSKFLAHYSAEKMAKAHEAIYRELVPALKPKLLVLSHAGALNVNRALFQALQRLGRFDVTMVVPRRWRGDLISDLRFERSPGDAGLKIHALPVLGSGNGSLFVYAGGLRSILRAERPDLIFLDEEPWSLSAGQLCWLAGARARVTFYTKQNLRKVIPLPFRLLEHWVFHRSSAAFAVESEVGEVLHWKGYSKQVVDLPHSFDPALFRPRSAAERVAKRAELELSASKLLVLYCGRLTEAKGIRDLLRAMETLESRTPAPNMEFLLVGNGPLYSDAEALCHRLRNLRARVTAAAPHHEIGQVMSCADILVLPSRTTAAWKEQFGRVLVEAMACGLAVVGSNSGAIGRVIQRTGGGLVFPEGDANALAQALLSLELDRALLDRLRSSGQAHVHRELTHEAMAVKLEQSIQQYVIKSRAPIPIGKEP